MTSTTDCTVTVGSLEANRDRALAALWDHFAVPAILETLRVAELAGIDVSGSFNFYGTASNSQVSSTSIGPSARP